MDIKVIGKTLDTAPIKYLLRQGEANVDRLSIPLAKLYGGTDISGFGFELRAFSEKETMAKQTLLKKVSADTVTLTWVVSPTFTVVDGLLDLVLVGMDADGFEIIKFTGDKIVVQKTQGEFQMPMPSVVEDALKQMAIVANRAAASADLAEGAADRAETAELSATASAALSTQKAAEAGNSAAAAKVSETASEDALTDINTGLASRLPIAAASNMVLDVTLDELTGVLTFTRYDGTVFTIDTALEKTVVNFTYDTETCELMLELESGQIIRIPLTDLIDDYTGKDTATISVMINGNNEVTAQIKGGSISMSLLDLALQNTINGKVTANQTNNASQIKFADSQTMQQKLDSGALNGKDGVAVSVSGFYSMAVNAAGRLILTVNDGTEPPQLAIDASGHLIYTVG